LSKIENQIINQIKKYLMTAEQLKTEITSLWKHVNELKAKYPKYADRPFTVDGHLLGTLGEIYASEKFGLPLNKSGEKNYDATIGGKNYQIKTTQTKKVGFKKPLADAELIIIQISKNTKELPKLSVYKVSGEYIKWNNDKPTYVGIQLLETLYKENKAQKEVI